MASTDAHSTLPLPRFTAPVHVMIALSPYYTDIAAHLLQGAEAVLDQVGATYDVVNMPGALEIPPAICLAEPTARYDGYVALGCIVRGETTHYDTVCNDSSRGLMLLGLEGLCIGNGILTVENMAQAEARANPAKMDKGGGTAAAALHLIAHARAMEATR